MKQKYKSMGVIKNIYLKAIGFFNSFLNLKSITKFAVLSIFISAVYIVVSIANLVISFNNEDILKKIKNINTIKTAMVLDGRKYFYISGVRSGFYYDLFNSVFDKENTRNTFDGSLQINIKDVSSKEELTKYFAKDKIDLFIGYKYSKQEHGSKYNYSNKFISTKIFVVTAKKSVKTKKSLEDINTTLFVQSRYKEVVRHINKTKNLNIHWVNTEHSLNIVVSQLLNNEVDSIVMDEFEFNLYKMIYPNIEKGFVLEDNLEICFVTKMKGSQRLIHTINESIAKLKSENKIQELYRKYFAYGLEINKHNATAFLTSIRDVLPKYRAFFQKAGSDFDIDWRLLASIAYQESHWNNNAISPTGVRGIMMLTKGVAKRFGVEDRMDAKQSIYAGAEYLRKLLNRLKEAPAPDKYWIALGSYNLGFQHIKDVRLMLQKYKILDNVWDNIAKKLPRLEKHKYYSKTKYGYARGRDAVIYVRNIRRFYDVLKHVEKKN